VALPATHVERPHAVGAHVAEGHRVAGWGAWSIGHGRFAAAASLAATLAADFSAAIFRACMSLAVVNCFSIFNVGSFFVLSGAECLYAGPARAR
jgi:hypothetical protein